MGRDCDGIRICIADGVCIADGNVGHLDGARGVWRCGRSAAMGRQNTNGWDGLLWGYRIGLLGIEMG